MNLFRPTLDTKQFAVYIIFASFPKFNFFIDAIKLNLT